MTQVIKARVREGGKEYSFNPGELVIEPGQGVMVSTPKGPEYAVCTVGNHEVDESTLLTPLRPVLRLAEEADVPQEEEKQPAPAKVERVRRELTEAERKRAKEAMSVCRAKIEQQGLEMSLVRCEPSADGGKLVFYFTAENRVDFRALVKDLAATLHARIELRQIGVRDETKMLGGIGICGQPYCCCRFLDKFQPVSIKMAKTQNLSLNPTKISGTCGRLMCCLKYEQGAYEDAVKRCPRQESFVECPDGVGTVSSVNLLKEQVKVKLEDSDEQPRSYLNDEIRVVRPGKGKRPEGYEPPPKAELEKLRTEEGERMRSGGRRLEGPADLGEVLERYLGTDTQSGQNDGQRQGSRGRRGGQPPDRQPKGAASKEAPTDEFRQGRNHKRRYRPHHRRSNKPGGGQAPQ